MKKSLARSGKVIKRPMITLPVEVWKALNTHCKKMGVDVNGGTVRAIELWVESTQDQAIFPG